MRPRKPPRPVSSSARKLPGDDKSLGERLGGELELRWYVPKDDLRHFRADGDLADTIGWFTDERGERGGSWPISYAAPVNALY